MSQYIITDGKRYIFKTFDDKYVPTHNESLAEIFTKKQAENIFKSNLPKVLRKVFRVEKRDDISEKSSPKDVKQVTQTDMDNTEKVMLSDNIQRWIDRLSDLNSLTNEALHKKEELLGKLGEVNGELCDIFHYLEFANLNASQGYKVYKLIKERRIRRRSIKNELTVLNIILEQKIGEMVVDDIIKRVSGLDNRTYSPRVLEELFDI